MFIDSICCPLILRFYTFDHFVCLLNSYCPCKPTYDPFIPLFAFCDIWKINQLFVLWIWRLWFDLRPKNFIANQKKTLLSLSFKQLQRLLKCALFFTPYTQPHATIFSRVRATTFLGNCTPLTSLMREKQTKNLIQNVATGSLWVYKMLYPLTWWPVLQKSSW